MNKNLILCAPVLAFVLSACEMPDIAGLNGMSKTTAAMSDKMSETNEAIRLQKMGIALDNLEKPQNQARISPIPSGLMAWAKIFAEAATPDELMEFTYLSLKAIEEVNPATGLDQDGVPPNYTDADKLRVRLEKTASLSGLMAITCFVQDGKVEAIIAQNYPRGRYAETAMNFLALRAAFIRDTILAQSLNIRADSPKVLTNSGMMTEALKYLYKLERISRASFADEIQVKVQEKQYNLMSFEEKQDAAGLKATADMWNMALQKANSGIGAFHKKSWTADEKANDQIFNEEVVAQNAVANTMLNYVNAWKARQQ